MIKLEDTEIFAGIQAETMEVIKKVGRIECYDRNRTCFQAKSMTNKVYIMLEGKAAVYNLTHAGKRKTIFFLGEGALLNDQIMPGTHPSVFCEILVKSQVFVLPSQVLLEQMEGDFALTSNVLRIMERRLWRMSHQLKNSVDHLDRKLAAKLWKLSRDFGKETGKGLLIDIPLSITDLADFLGASRETTSRICKSLSEKGLIEIESRRIYILSPDQLSAFYKK